MQRNASLLKAPFITPTRKSMLHNPLRVVTTRVFPLAVALLAALAFPAPSSAQNEPKLSKGYRILLERGIQLQGNVTTDDVFTLSTYRDLGYTSVNWLFGAQNKPNSDLKKLGPAPGAIPWARWVADEQSMPHLIPGERPYLKQLIGLSLADERDLRVPKVRDETVKWFESVRDNPAYANTILYTNNYGGQAPDDALSDFVPRAKPDMLFFDVYPFKCQWDESKPEHIGATQPADVLPWLSELRRYRQWSINHGIPFGAYMQTFHSVQDYDHTVYRDPSPSELRYNNNAAVAFNAKYLTGFTYNTGASSLFIKPGGDTHRSPLYAEQKLVNRRLRNWSNALVRLTPVADLRNPSTPDDGTRKASNNANFPEGTTTSILILRGQDAAGKPTGLPIGFQPDPDETRTQKYSWWEYRTNDPYLNGWSVKNAGTKNAGQPGDVILAGFRVLDERFDGEAAKDEVYVMVVNALTDPTGSADDCAQAISLTFANLPDGDRATPGNQGVALLDPDTGKIVTPTLAPVGGGKVQLSLKLAGGDAALLKFNNGAPFVGVNAPQPAAAAAGAAGRK
jgi:hypothetical protein